MEIKTVYAVYFSATGRTRKVVTTLANAIAQTLELPLETVDFTLPAAREETYAFTDKDLVIFGTPTYAGKVPNTIAAGAFACSTPFRIRWLRAVPTART